MVRRVQNIQPARKDLRPHWDRATIVISISIMCFPPRFFIEMRLSWTGCTEFFLRAAANVGNKSAGIWFSMQRQRTDEIKRCNSFTRR